MINGGFKSPPFIDAFWQFNTLDLCFMENIVDFFRGENICFHAPILSYSVRKSIFLIEKADFIPEFVLLSTITTQESEVTV